MCVGLGSPSDAYHCFLAQILSLAANDLFFLSHSPVHSCFSLTLTRRLYCITTAARRSCRCRFTPASCATGISLHRASLLLESRGTIRILFFQFLVIYQNFPIDFLGCPNYKGTLPIFLLTIISIMFI